MPVQDPVVSEQTPAADHTIDQCWERYTAEEHGVWDTLYARQMKVLQGRPRPSTSRGWNCSSWMMAAFPISGG